LAECRAAAVAHLTSHGISTVRRHHVSDQSFQRALRGALRDTDIIKLATVWRTMTAMPTHEKGARIEPLVQPERA